MSDVTRIDVLAALRQLVTKLDALVTALERQQVVTERDEIELAQVLAQLPRTPTERPYD